MLSAEATFNQITKNLIASLGNDEHILLSLNCERSQFVRFNRRKVRQSGFVDDGTMTLTLIHNGCEASTSFSFTGNLQIDEPFALAELAHLRSEIKLLPPNPYLVLPQFGDSSREVFSGKILECEAALEAILTPAENLDFTGLYAAGEMMRGFGSSIDISSIDVSSIHQSDINSVKNLEDNSLIHWFETASFCVDYSIFNEQNRAVKGIYAGQNWDQTAYGNQIQQSRQQIMALDLLPREIPCGEYRVYFAPSATADLIGMLTGAVGAAGLQQGSSALLKLFNGEECLSDLFNLQEKFDAVPRFNELGVIAAPELAIIAKGRLANPLVSAKTAKEYNLIANGANNYEYMRAPVVSAGTLKRSEILAKLGTGLYISNLHYLNWSDHAKGRITGMTRYACFWVENGEIVAPIENLRFDDSIYDFLGSNLVAFTDFQEFMPNTDTYGSRSLGGMLSPGMLVNNFTFTL